MSRTSFHVPSFYCDFIHVCSYEPRGLSLSMEEGKMGCLVFIIGVMLMCNGWVFTGLALILIGLANPD